jgi:carbamate kinase
MKTAVIAIGGNAILLAGESGSKEDQLKNLEASCGHLAEMVADGYDIVFTHGNGPQVGNILLRNDIAKKTVAPMPLDIAVAESQGQIGYMFQQVLSNKLRERGLEKCVVSVVTQVVVDENDRAFQNPTKPIGSYYPTREAKKLMKIKGWKMVEDKARGGWRRVVPSPVPIDIVEKNAIKRLIFSGENSSIIVIAAGGGGIPVVRRGQGYVGVEAVIDKDLASGVLASSIGEDLFIMLTDVPKVALNYGKKNQVDLDRLTLDDAWRYYGEEQFPPGSMGPKIQAAIRFIGRGGKRVIITSPERLRDAVAGKDGTHITR